MWGYRRRRHARILLGAIFFATCLIQCESSASLVLRPQLKNHPFNRFLILRGGASDEESEYEDAVEEFSDEDEESGVETSSGSLMGLSKKILVLLGRATVATSKAASRAVMAAFQSDDEISDEEEEPPSVMTRLVRTIRRMWTAAFTLEESTEKPTSSPAARTKKSKPIVKEETLSDFGTYLASAYGVSVERNENATQVLGGTIGDALREARSKARLLVVFIPSARPQGKKRNTPDHEAIASFLSSEVSQVCSSRARKKEESGSFLLWGAKASSPESVTAIKRLKAKQPSKKNDKRPVLLVAYPAQVLDSRGTPKLVPRLLAQHHCSPPPSPELMAAWLNALRKRHAKQYAAMHHEQKEARLFKERTEGYKSSVTSDLQRREEERIAEQERLAKEAAEKEHVAMLEQRREKLRASLPDEPSKDAGMTFALRFANGQTGQRRFLPETPLGTLFNWVDCMFEMEREQVILTTMNGQKSFSWEDTEDGMTLADTGLGKMTGLRVTEKKKEEAKEESESS